jgi:hypothetical protein
MDPITFPPRVGSRPRTTPTNPHQQLDQHPPIPVFEELCERLFAMPHVIERPSAISVPGARALWLSEEEARGPQEAFMVMTEFAHVHPLPDGSLHVALPPEVAEEAIRQGWAEQHPVARRGLIPSNVCMVYAPRSSEEVDLVVGLVAEALRFARGAPK